MALFEKGELRFLWPFYLEILVSAVFFILPAFMVVYFQGINLSLTKIGFLISSAFLAQLLFEIPTSALADIWGRKICVVLGFILGGITLISIGIVREYYIIFPLFFIYGISGTLMSGAYEAWIIDNLRFNKKSHLTKNFYVHRQVILNFSLFFSGILAVFLVRSLGLGAIWFFSGFSFLISGVILFFIKEFKLSHKREEKNFIGFLNQNKESIRYSLKHKTILIILMASLIGAIAWGLSSDLVINPLLKGRGMPIYWLGYLFSINALIGIFVPFISKRILKKNRKESKFIAYLFFFNALILLSIIFTKSWISVALIYLGAMAIFDIRMPLFGNFFQRLIPSKKRATIISINSLAISVGAIIGGPLAGFLADNLSLELTIVFGGLLTIITATLFLKIKV